jgi:hypothetical protein
MCCNLRTILPVSEVPSNYSLMAIYPIVPSGLASWPSGFVQSFHHDSPSCHSDFVRLFPLSCPSYSSGFVYLYLWDCCPLQSIRLCAIVPIVLSGLSLLSVRISPIRTASLSCPHGTLKWFVRTDLSHVTQISSNCSLRTVHLLSAPQDLSCHFLGAIF